MAGHTAFDEMGSLARVRSEPGGVVVLCEEDETFVIAPATLVHASEGALNDLVYDLNKVVKGPFTTGERVRVTYRTGSVADLGEEAETGGRIERGVWVNGALRRFGLAPAIRDTLVGSRNEPIPLRSGWTREIVRLVGLVAALSVTGVFDGGYTFAEFAVRFALAVVVSLAADWLFVAALGRVVRTL